MVNKVVQSDPEILHGAPVFAGTRVPVQNLWDYLERGHGLEGFLEGFPGVKKEQALWVIERARRIDFAESA
ncbi:MAG: DUF433 domain-containing protein [Gammaproteobacteria bacterium]|nr:DUF433 domain-containing protein [Gammaproteobacteria bacterium]MXW45751.1 DUF433 domain-containing protein [Gammaproteobacteria bacterium]MYD03115.1 DUF433 domain-containing protein [Gammaproteobacteria bacterium]MYI25738.1 DUF433 domain-containing protein [Gammaproteobacteria bacterium]